MKISDCDKISTVIIKKKYGHDKASQPSDKISDKIFFKK